MNPSCLHATVASSSRHHSRQACTSLHVAEEKSSCTRPSNGEGPPTRRMPSVVEAARMYRIKRQFKGGHRGSIDKKWDDIYTHCTFSFDLRSSLLKLDVWKLQKQGRGRGNFVPALKVIPPGFSRIMFLCSIWHKPLGEKSWIMQWPFLQIRSNNLQWTGECWQPWLVCSLRMPGMH